MTDGVFIGQGTISGVVSGAPRAIGGNTGAVGLAIRVGELPYTATFFGPDAIAARATVPGQRVTIAGTLMNWPGKDVLEISGAIVEAP